MLGLCRMNGFLQCTRLKKSPFLIQLSLSCKCIVRLEELRGIKHFLHNRFLLVLVFLSHFPPYLDRGSAAIYNIIFIQVPWVAQHCYLA